MPRNKSAKDADIKMWLSAKTDCKEGRFIQVGNSLLLSKTFQNLSGVSKILYLGMAMECGGKNTFTFPARSAKKYGITGSSFDRAKKELQEAGFIKLILDKDRSQFKPCTFMFVVDWKTKTAPQNDIHRE